MPPDLTKATVLIVGAGVMGTGIAQVVAIAGHTVQWYDQREGAVRGARRALKAVFDKLTQRGKVEPDVARAALERICCIDRLEEARGAHLVIEAIIEDLDQKRQLLGRLEGVLDQETVFATNTSSLSVTAIAAQLQHPGRVVGMHFFNPAPVMPLVEVACGLDTMPPVAEAVFALARRWGKEPVYTASTPGFIVNRIARPFYAEALELLQERACDPVTIDACLRGAGFRMGPCELMDLIGHDTNFAVTESIYHAHFMDKRFKPSLVQKALIEGGRLGRKSGRGFYHYAPDADPNRRDTPAHTYHPPPSGTVRIHGRGFVADLLGERIKTLGWACEQVNGSTWIGLDCPDGQLRLTDGRPATALGAQVAIFDLPITPDERSPLAIAVSTRASSAWRAQSLGWLASLGFVPQAVSDTPGLLVARTIAMLINEAADAVQQGVCTQSGADQAMKLGVNYPMGPFEWLLKWGVVPVVTLLDRLDAYYRGERYRVSPWLRQQAWSSAPLDPSSEGRIS